MYNGRVESGIGSKGNRINSISYGVLYSGVESGLKVQLRLRAFVTIGGTNVK